jgi:UDP-2,4-diacetamido-2,4,6-trideoxy-beta-L-altropyranose hydrolase
MKIFFRVDSSNRLGTGHVMRCLTLAIELRNHGHECFFICRKFQGDITYRVLEAGFDVYSLPSLRGELAESNRKLSSNTDTDILSYGKFDAEQTISLIRSTKPDLLIVDHYFLDENWESIIKPYCLRLMVIDDLANRRHNCDILLDQTFARVSDDYYGLLSNDTKLLLGTSFALLRPEFKQLRNPAISKRSKGIISNILISFGGANYDTLIIKTLSLIASAGLDFIPRVHVITGNGSKDSIVVSAKTRGLDNFLTLTVEKFSDCMYDWIYWADLGIGAAGATTWERCCLALPSILVVLADNQVVIANKMLSAEAACVFNDKHEYNEGFCSALRNLSTNSINYINISNRTAQLCDGEGLKRVISNII